MRTEVRHYVNDSMIGSPTGRLTDIDARPPQCGKPFDRVCVWSCNRREDLAQATKHGYAPIVAMIAV